MIFRKLLLACFFCSTMACSSFGRPSVTAQSPEFKGVSPSGLQLEMELKVDNPNPFAMVAKEITGTLSFGKKQKTVGSASVTLSDSIEAGKSATMQSELEIAWTSLSALGEFIGHSRVPLTFHGEVLFSGGPLSVKVPFTIHGELTRKQLTAAGSIGLGSLKGLLSN